MTGRELIEWIQENNAEDLDVLLDVQCETIVPNTIELVPGQFAFVIC